MDGLKTIKQKMIKDGAVLKLDLREKNMFGKLHPAYVSKHFTFIGKVYNMLNAMNLINKDDEALKYINRKLTFEDITNIKKMKTKNVPRYWDIVKLILVDRIFSDVELFKEITMYEFPIDFWSFETIIPLKRGMITTYVTADKHTYYNKVLKDVITELLEELEEFENDLNADALEDHDSDVEVAATGLLEEYEVIKAFKLRFKKHAIEKMLEKDDTTILNGVTNIELKEKYIS